MTEDQASTIDVKLDQILVTAKAAKKAVNLRTLAFVVVLVFLAYFQVAQFRQGRDIKSITRSTNDNSRAIKNATSPEAAARNASNIAGYLAQLSMENDCRSRRQQARLSAPVVGSTCASQTPESVYPGIAGLPARG